MKTLFAACVAAMLCTSAVAQSNLGKDTRDAPSAKFTPEDFEMFWALVDTVSREKVVGKTQKWDNAATGNGGSIKLLRSFTSTDGRDCRRLKVENHAKTVTGVSNQTVCASPDGKWLIDADARPKPKA